jgi:phosphate transport system permease protein
MASFGADRRRKIVSAFMTTLTGAFTLLAVGALVVILSYIAYRGVGSLNIQFLVDRPRPVGEGGGIGNAIIGSMVLLLLSSVIGLPLGISVGVYLSEIGRGRLAGIIRFIVDTLTGIPSIVTGVFIYAIFVLPMKHFSAFAGGIALAMIMIPIVARTTEEMLKLVPHSMREGALALGAPQWKVILGVIIPAAAPGIATGAMLAIARVSGETAPLLFTAFGSRFFPESLNQPIASLTVQIYNYAISPYDEWHAQAWAATLVLMTLILGINIMVRFVTRKRF